jgi:hypothetical protein
MAGIEVPMPKEPRQISQASGAGGVLYSYFSDPDGNMWALQQWPAGYRA